MLGAQGKGLARLRAPALGLRNAAYQVFTPDFFSCCHTR